MALITVPRHGAAVCIGGHIITFTSWYGLISLSLGVANRAAGRVDQQRAKAHFKEVGAICQREWRAALGRVAVRRDGGTRRVPGPVRIDGATLTGDGWVVTVAPGWTVRPGPRSGDYQIVREPH